MNKSIIIDTDPGVDDFLAIMFAIFANLNIKGITTIYGNSTIENTTKNALTIIELLEKEIGVYKGASQPLVKEPVLANSHGQNGLGGFEIPNLNRKVNSLNAIEFLIRSLEEAKEKTTLFCLGPLTNIAILFNLKPELTAKVDKLIILGGVIDEKGNKSPVAEFNAYNDPGAFKRVIDLNIEKVLIPANVCRKVQFTLEDFNLINNEQLSEKIKTIIKVYIDYYQTAPGYGGFKGGVMYDLLTVAYFLNPNIFKTHEVYVDIETADVKTKALTFINGSIESNCTLCTDVSSDEVKDLFFTTMNNGKN